MSRRPTVAARAGCALGRWAARWSLEWSSPTTTGSTRFQPCHLAQAKSGHARVACEWVVATSKARSPRNNAEQPSSTRLWQGKQATSRASAARCTYLVRARPALRTGIRRSRGRYQAPGAQRRPPGPPSPCSSSTHSSTAASRSRPRRCS
eukprot:scaffold5178_cov364-Prasinococcus_capsulatus_cf.AAC.17